MTEQRIFNKKVRDLDPAIWSLAQQEELGELHRIHNATQYTTRLVVLATLCLVFGFSCMISAILLSVIPDVTNSPPLPAILLFGICLLAIGGCLLIPRRIYANWRIYLCERGFIYQKGPLRQVFRWNQIEHIQGNVATSPQSNEILFSYKVRHHNGYEVNLTNKFQDTAQLIDAILDGFSRYAANRELAFVPPRDKVFALNFRLDLQGIRDQQGTTLGWQDIQELTIERGTMAVLKGKSDHPTFEEIQNERL